MSERAPFLTHVYCPWCYDGIVTAWYVEVGQQVKAGAKIGIVTDRQNGLVRGISRLFGKWLPSFLKEKIASVPIIAPYSGRVAKILKAPGEEVDSGTLLLLLAETKGMNEEIKGKPIGHHLVRWDADDGKRRRVWKDDGFRCIAEAAGVGHITVLRWLSGPGDEHPTDEQLVAIAVLLGVSEEELEAARQAIAAYPLSDQAGEHGE